MAEIADTLGDPALEALLVRLHAQSHAEDASLARYFDERAEGGGWERLDADAHRFLAGKMVALEADKAQLCHRLCLALRARRIVEAGTSHGVSTLYLAQALRRIEEIGGPHGTVIATEYEAHKAEIARANFTAARLSGYIELREGDLRETLRTLEGPIDFVLLDIWEVALAALELIAPHLRPGAIVVADNSAQFRAAYAEYFAFLRTHGFTTQTLPFEGGFELSVKL